MCYLIAKESAKRGCVAFRTENGPHVVAIKRSLFEYTMDKDIELVTISRPSAYGEYELYRFVDSEEAFREAVLDM